MSFKLTPTLRGDGSGTFQPRHNIFTIATAAVLGFIAVAVAIGQVRPIVESQQLPLLAVGLAMLLVSWTLVLTVTDKLIRPNVNATPKSVVESIGIGGLYGAVASAIVIGLGVGVPFLVAPTQGLSSLPDLASLLLVTGSIGSLSILHTEAGQPLKSVLVRVSGRTEDTVSTAADQTETSPASGESDRDTSPQPDSNGKAGTDAGRDAGTSEPTRQNTSGSRGESSSTEPEYVFDWQVGTDVSMDDIGGMEEVKDTLRRDIVRPLTVDRERAKEMGIPLVNVLFYGPPGTGKTFLAKGLASELELPFVAASGGDITSKWVNESSQRVNTLFTEAKEMAAQHGGAVIFVDEVDSVLPSRGGAGAHTEDEKVTNEFLNHLDDTSAHDIIFIGATNRADGLDSAATRRGRIDRKIEIPLPDHEARQSILEAQLESRAHRVSQSMKQRTAQETEGCNAADIEELVNHAARIAVFEKDTEVISDEDLADALDESGMGA